MLAAPQLNLLQLEAPLGHSVPEGEQDRRPLGLLHESRKGEAAGDISGLGQQVREVRPAMPQVVLEEGRALVGLDQVEEGDFDPEEAPVVALAERGVAHQVPQALPPGVGEAVDVGGMATPVGLPDDQAVRLEPAQQRVEPAIAHPRIGSDDDR